jgi:hypothetical protein
MNTHIQTQTHKLKNTHVSKQNIKAKSVEIVQGNKIFEKRGSLMANCRCIEGSN